jgi:isoleucyl-tRNA synthetase
LGGGVGAMSAVRTFASLARAAREVASLRVRQPLDRMKVAMPQSVDRALFRSFEELLKAEVNVKVIEVVGSDGDLVRLRGKGNFRTLGKVYGKETPQAAAVAAELTADELRRLESGEGVRRVTAAGETFEFRPEDVVIDPSLTEELLREGIAREVVNRIQRLRKEAGYEYTDRIAVSITGDPVVLAAVQGHYAFIIGETLARGLDTARDLPKPDIRDTVDIDGLAAVISLSRQQDAPSGKSGAPATTGKPAKKAASRKKSAVKKPGRKGK